MENNTYVKAEGAYYRGILEDVPASTNLLQPLFESFTNSLESIVLKQDKSDNGKVIVRLFSYKNLSQELEFQKIEIEDNGVGFNDTEFKRFTVYKDNRKGFNNKGSGRLQIVHFFKEANYISIYKDSEGFKERSFSISKDPTYLKENSITFHKETKPINAVDSKTTLTLTGLLVENSKFDKLSLGDLKEAIISHYILYFCSIREKMPLIKLEHFVDDTLSDENWIRSSDIPEIHLKQRVKVDYYKVLDGGKTFEKAGKEEVFELKSFKIPKEKLKENLVKLTVKDEVVEKNQINIESLPIHDHIQGNRYLFLLSSPYLDTRDGDVRGELRIPSKDELRRLARDGASTAPRLFDREEILLEDLKEKINSEILNAFPEIVELNNQHKTDIENLKAMFLIHDDTLRELSLSLNDSEEKILEKFYTAEAKAKAKKDAKIKERMDSLDQLNPTLPDFEERFKKEVSELVKQIPLQNRVELTHYIARRKLVLKLFEKILNNQLHIQKAASRNIDEKLLHNLIFQQGAQTPEKSDLWLISDDFVYFNGTSEGQLGDIKINGEKILKETLTGEEEKYRDSLDENRYSKRPDVLLFPSEGKCIIIEFKNPSVNVSNHISQINNYASLLRNLCKDEFDFHTFYGYLIGEKLDADDIQNKDSSFVSASHFDYVFRPYYRVRGKFGRDDGSLYTEAISYSTLLNRAAKRNELFIKKLGENHP